MLESAVYSFDGVSLEVADLGRSPSLLTEFIKGQQLALREFGVNDDEIVADAHETPVGSYAVIARMMLSGKMVGGVRVHSRATGPLPIESELSPLPPVYRSLIAREPNLCEIGALWVDPRLGGRFLSRKLVALGTLLAYQQGFDALVGLSHARAFKFISSPVGFMMDSRIPAMAYPDDRFETFVVWHRAGPKVAQLALNPVRPHEVAEPIYS